MSLPFLSLSPFVPRVVDIPYAATVPICADCTDCGQTDVTDSTDSTDSDDII